MSEFEHQSGKPLDCLCMALKIHKQEVALRSGEKIYKIGMSIGGGIDQDCSKSVYKDNGVYVTQVEPGSPAEEAGLKVHDKLLQVNRIDYSGSKIFEEGCCPGCVACAIQIRIMVLGLAVIQNKCAKCRRKDEPNIKHSISEENVSSDRLHPADTDELNKCLSPDLEEEEKSQFRFFAAVIDAGSTGTRLHIFEFSHDTVQDPSTFKLEAETYRETKPGVSAFAKTPEQAAENIRVLLLIAKKHIPEDLWAKTPIAFRATAGVRLLNDKEAEGLLSHIEAEIMSSGLLVDDDAVGMLSGTDEGVFGWFTLNFLLERLDNVLNGSGKAASALDLGGGSTQVTFIPSDFNNAMRGLPRQKYSHRLKIFEKELRLYTHSYLGNGLVASRLGIAKLSTPDWSPGLPALKTHCLPKKFILDDFDYAGNVWLISATTDASFENCLVTARNYVTNLTDVKPIKSLVNEEDLYLFGYFYDRGLQGNIVEYTLEQIGGEAKVGDYKIAAEKACAMPAEAIGPEPWQPWQCLDLTYIYTLLHYGYGLPDERNINLVKKIRSMEVSWALGAGFHLLNSYHESKLKESRDEKQRQLREALERDRQELEARRKAIEEKEAATDRRLASLSTLAKLIHWVSEWMTHLLTTLNLIS